MPGPRLPMRKIRDVLRLSAAGMSKRKIKASQLCSSVGADSFLAEEHKYSICKLYDKSSQFASKSILFSITYLS